MARVKKEKKEKKPKKEKKEKTGKKGGKKKLLLIPIILVLLGGGAFAVVRFVLPMLGGGDEDMGAPPKKGLESYTIEEDIVAALDTILEEGEGELIAIRGPGKNTSGPGATSESENMGERYTYIYELEGYAAVIDRYLDLLLSEEGFSLVDENYMVLEERPELMDEYGALVVAKTSALEGRVFQLAMGWSQSSGNLAIRVASPEGALQYPTKGEESGPPAASVKEQVDSLESMTPAHLALEGSSMSEYEISPVMGFVNIDGYDCRRFNLYKKGQSGNIAGIIFYSGDMQHIYRMDVDDNSIITELKGSGY